MNRQIRYGASLLLIAGIALAGCGGSHSNDNVSNVGHTAPIGSWGGTLTSNATPATLTLTNSGGHFDFSCGQTADITQPVQPDSTGRFSVPGTATLGYVPNRPAQKAQFTGTVTNHVMTVSLLVTPTTGSAFTDGPYTVTFGQAAPIFQGACPG